MPLHRKSVLSELEIRKEQLLKQMQLIFNPINNVAAVQHVCYVANKV